MRREEGKNKFINYGPEKVTRLILYGSLGVAIILTLLLIFHDLLALGYFRVRVFVGLVVIIYLFISWHLVRKARFRTVNWMLVILYIGLAFATLLSWGLNAAVGIFTTSFVIILSGILLGSSSILPIALCIVFMLCIVQFIHTIGIIKPDLTALSIESSFLDVISYATILGVFALVTWISDSQMEKTLKRANDAEALVRAQKDTLSIELERESSRLRQVQLKEIQQLYKFATLGQSTAATLHELSNHLSVLNLDIEDLKQHLQNSNAIANAKDGIEQINLMVRQVRQKLDSYDDTKVFNAITVVRRALKDQREKFDLKHVSLEYIHDTTKSASINGDPLALLQIVTVLLHNALDACYELPNPKVVLETRLEDGVFILSVIDNGIGISDSLRPHIFTPTLSTKPSGMGVGLYIAKHLIKTQFKGKIWLEHSSSAPRQGAHFSISIKTTSRKGLTYENETN